MTTATTDTPRTDTCPHCGAEYKRQEDADYLCGSIYWPHTKSVERSELCCEREARLKAEAEAERLRVAMRSFIDFMDDNLGTTADWPMEMAFDDEETCQRSCDHLNAMKRLVKPEDIN